jgi:hypothetical protein
MSESCCSSCSIGGPCETASVEELQARLLGIDQAITLINAGLEATESHKSLAISYSNAQAAADAEASRETIARKRSLLTAERQRTLVALCNAAPETGICQTLGPVITSQPIGQKDLTEIQRRDESLIWARKVLRRVGGPLAFLEGKPQRKLTEVETKRIACWKGCLSPADFKETMSKWLRREPTHLFGD